jgi:hypothetical protein
LAYSRLEDFGSLDNQEAISAIKSNAEKALLLDNQSGTAHLAIAFSFGAQRKFDKRKEAIKKAYALEPNNPEILVYYGRNAVENNLVLQMELAEKAYGIDPLSPTVIENMGNNYFKNENYIRAHGNLVRLLRAEPNGKLGEAFITAYKAYQQFPENLNVISLLAYTSMDLKFFNFVDELSEKITLLYPENSQADFIKEANYFHQKKVVKSAKTLNKLLLKYNIKRDKYDPINARISNFYFLGKTKEALNYLKTHHPIYLSDTLSTVPYQNMWGLSSIAAFLKHSGDLKQASRLTEIYGNELRSKFEYQGDLKKEKIEFILYYKEWASLSGDGKLASEILEKLYFKRKGKYNAYQDLHGITTDLISEAPEFKAIDAKITKDIMTMRDKAILFLEGEGDWPLHKINE